MSNNIVKFDNKEYVWQEVEGKGKCLVPFKEVNPFKGISVGTKLLFSNIFEYRVAKVNNFYTIMYNYSTDSNYYSDECTTLSELERHLFNCAKKIKQVDLWKIA